MVWSEELAMLAMKAKLWQLKKKKKSSLIIYMYFWHKVTYLKGSLKYKLTENTNT